MKESCDQARNDFAREELAIVLRVGPASIPKVGLPGLRRDHSLMLGASGTLFQWARLSAMILVECRAAWVMVA